MIFLSHTFLDKPVVEPIALYLSGIFGEAEVFYDSWSIQPGDGIIDMMNKGLANPDFVFFFVSEKSLQSGMVKLEWQNALFKATKGQCKLIPVRVDGTPMPSLLTQSLYIDMFVNGIEATARQMVNVIQGNVSYAQQHAGFSNLTWKLSGNPEHKIMIEVSASHLMEPRASFAFAFENSKDDASVWISGVPGVQSLPAEEQCLENGKIISVFPCSPIGGQAITPTFPITFEITARNGASLRLEAVMHEKSPGKYETIPRAG